MTDIKLTDTQIAILTVAVDRPDSNIEPMPSNLRGGARTKVIEGLRTRGLITNTDGAHLLTDAGYAAVGKCRPVIKGKQNVRTPESMQNMQATPIIRSGTKLAAIINAMRNPNGAGIAQMMMLTGWQAHTVRGAISGMIRKRLGCKVITGKGDDGLCTYRIV